MTREGIHKETFFPIRGDVLVCLFLIIATLAIYWQVRNHEFVNYDDPIFVTGNPYVKAGFTHDSLAFIFTNPSNIHRRFAMLTHMLDCELFGLDAGLHHLVNLLYHIANTLLLFLVFKRMTGAMWRSAFIATLFALHPLNVDSVAWIAERRNVLSTLFWMLTMLTYARYAERPGLIRYLVVLPCFVLGVMAKPMVVTLPFVLLLLDFWPLCRVRAGLSGNDDSQEMRKAETPGYQKRPIHSLVLEKVPFIAFAIAGGILTLFSVRNYVQPLGTFPLKVRIANAFVAYFDYIWKMIWPQDLAVLYPFNGVLPWWQVAGACVLIVFISLLVIKAFRSRPYLAVGWLWYIGTLVPVIGLVKYGEHSMADRYAYVPLIGIFIIISWGVAELLGRWRYREIGIATITATLFSILMAITWLQVGYWRNSITLFEHALYVDSNSTTAHYNLALALQERGRTAEAIRHYEDALRIQPGFVKAHNNLGLALEKEGRTTEAIDHYYQALRARPDSVKALNNLGLALAKQGNITEAINLYHKALRINPDSTETNNNLGLALVAQGKTAEAVRHYAEALRINPEFAEAHNNLGNALERQGRITEAVRHYTKALRLRPNFFDALNNLGNALRKQGKISEAIGHYLYALRLRPDSSETYNNLGLALAAQGKNTEAIRYYTKALEINPDSAEVHNNLGNALAEEGKIDEAMRHYTEALRINPDFAEAHNNLGVALSRIGKTGDAIAHFREALRIRPGYGDARSNLDKALAVSAKIRRSH